MTAEGLSYLSILHEEKRGFDFSNLMRNDALVASLQKNRVPLPPVFKTGTTICGVVCEDAVVLAADSRATQGTLTVDSACMKLKRLADNVYCAGAGTAADLEHFSAKQASGLELLRLATGSHVRVAAAAGRASAELHRYRGYIGVHLIIAGVDLRGASLFSLGEDGSVLQSAFAATGSGGLDAMNILTMHYRDNMSADEGVMLCRKAIRAGILNDLGSGSDITVAIIKKNPKVGDREPVATTEVVRSIERPVAHQMQRARPVTFSQGTTSILKQKIEKLKKHVVVVEEVNNDDEDVVM